MGEKDISKLEMGEKKNSQRIRERENVMLRPTANAGPINGFSLAD